MKKIAKTSDSGSIIYNSDIINQIIKCAFDEIEGVSLATPKTSSVNIRYKEGIKLEALGEYVYIDVYVKQDINLSVKETAYSIQQNIKNALETMTEFKVKDINVHVIDVDLS